MAASSVTRPYRRLEGDSSRDTDDEEEDGLQYQAPLYEVNRPINTYGATQRVGTVYKDRPIAGINPNVTDQESHLNKTVNAQPQPPPVSRTLVWLCRGMLSILLVLTLLSLCAALLCKYIPQDSHYWKETNSSEMLSGTAVLLHCHVGSPSTSQFMAHHEKPSGTQTNVTLSLVNCTDLVKRESQMKKDNISWEFDYATPELVPSNHYHFELGSAFLYSTALTSVPKLSGATIRIFNNTIEADYYWNHPTDPKARDKAFWVHPLETNTSSDVPFTPQYASYFVVMFDPNITGGHFHINVSYTINRTFYNHTDYMPYAKNCRLNSNESQCVFDLSDGQCVLGYNPPLTTSEYDDDENPILVTMRTNSTRENSVKTSGFFLFLSSFFILLVVLFITMITCFFLFVRLNRIYI